MFAVGFKNLSSNATIEAWQRGEIPIHAAYIVTNNFLATMGAQAEQQLEWYKQIDFIVVEDLFMTPTMMALADVVLPAATYEERDGFGGLNAYRISCINKAIEPGGDSKPDNTIFLELGKRLTHAIKPENDDIAWPWDNVQEMWDYALEDGGFTWEELRDATWKYPEFKYRKNETGDLRPDGQVGFRTETGRAEIYSMVFHHTSWSGLDPLPSYVEPVESPYSAPEDVEEYPYIVTSGMRVPHFFHSEQRQIEKLRALHPDPLCHIHHLMAHRPTSCPGGAKKPTLLACKLTNCRAGSERPDVVQHRVDTSTRTCKAGHDGIRSPLQIDMQYRIELMHYKAWSHSSYPALQATLK